MTTDLDRIDKDVDLQMALSELLFKALGMGCWHEWSWFSNYNAFDVDNGWWACCKDNCDEISETRTNPNLFTRSAFLDVFEAVKDSGWFKGLNWVSYKRDISCDAIASPSFQLEVLRWQIGEDKVKEVLNEKD